MTTDVDPGGVAQPAGRADYEQIADLERAAGELFRTVGMPSVADDAPISQPAFERFLATGAVWVWILEGEIVAYCLLEPVDGTAHLEQVSVHPTHGRLGIGARLIAAADVWARERGLRRITLTTFRDVPWNAAYYERLGFRMIPQSEWSSTLAERMGAESSRGLDAWPRVAMSRDVGLTPHGS
jgi:GNAT superfamily N-acetyltransferase